MVMQKIMLSFVFIFGSFLHAAQQQPSAPITIPTTATNKKLIKPSTSPTKFTFGNSPEALKAFADALSSHPHVKNVKSSPRQVSFTGNGCDKYILTTYSNTSDTESKQIESSASTTTTTAIFAQKLEKALQKHHGTSNSKGYKAAAAALIKNGLNIEQQYNKLENEYDSITADDYLDRQVKQLSAVQSLVSAATNKDNQ